MLRIAVLYTHTHLSHTHAHTSFSATRVIAVVLGASTLFGLLRRDGRPLPASNAANSTHAASGKDACASCNTSTSSSIDCSLAGVRTIIHLPAPRHLLSVQRERRRVWVRWRRRGGGRRKWPRRNAGHKRHSLAPALTLAYAHGHGLRFDSSAALGCVW